LRAASSFPTAYVKNSFADLCFTTYFINCCAFHRHKSILDILASNPIDELRPEDVSVYLGLNNFCIFLMNKHLISENEWNLDKKDIIIGLYQEQFFGQNQLCLRDSESGKNLVDDPSVWTFSIPNPKSKCFTYK